MPNDELFDLLWEHIDTVRSAYSLHATRRPVVLFDVQEQRIYVYPYDEFKADLNPRSQALLASQYERAVASNEIVVFVRDNARRKLVSYSIDYAETD